MKEEYRKQEMQKVTGGRGRLNAWYAKGRGVLAENPQVSSVILDVPSGEEQTHGSSHAWLRISSSDG